MEDEAVSDSLWTFPTTAESSIIRRAFDAGLALALLILAVPVLLVVSMCVLVSMGRPVLFHQHRSGLHGTSFSIHKFRTMRAPRYCDETDPERATRIGNILRLCSLDELPQLWNIVRGDMTFIGPRPTLPEQVARYTDRQRGRLSVLPGVTGWAQINGRNSLTWPERIELDLWYVEHRSFLLDARIVAMTLWALVHPDGVTAAGGINPDFPGDGHVQSPLGSSRE